MSLATNPQKVKQFVAAKDFCAESASICGRLDGHVHIHLSPLPLAISAAIEI